MSLCVCWSSFLCAVWVCLQTFPLHAISIVFRPEKLGFKLPLLQSFLGDFELIALSHLNLSHRVVVRIMGGRIYTNLTLLA